MSYFNHSDYELCYNSSEVRSQITEIKGILTTLENKINDTVIDIERLEENTHDVPQTKVDNDYIGIEKIFDEFGIKNTIKNIQTTLDNLSGEMSSYESSVRENQERRRREEEERRRREEEERRRQQTFNSFRIQ